MNGITLILINSEVILDPFVLLHYIMNLLTSILFIACLCFKNIMFLDGFRTCVQNSSGSAVKKPKVPVASVFGNDSDEE